MSEPFRPHGQTGLNFVESIELVTGLALGGGWVGYRWGWDLLVPVGAVFLVVSALWRTFR